MNISLETDRVELADSQILRIDRPQGVRIVCIRGSVWITQYRDLRDFFVPAGSSLDLDRHGPALISALEPSCVWLHEPVRRPGLFERIVPAAMRVLLRALRAGRERAATQLPGYF